MGWGGGSVPRPTPSRNPAGGWWGWTPTNAGLRPASPTGHQRQLRTAPGLRPAHHGSATRRGGQTPQRVCAASGMRAVRVWAGGRRTPWAARAAPGLRPAHHGSATRRGRASAAGGAAGAGRRPGGGTRRVGWSAGCGRATTPPPRRCRVRRRPRRVPGEGAWWGLRRQMVGSCTRGERVSRTSPGCRVGAEERARWVPSGVTSELSPAERQPWWPAPTSCWRRRSCG